MSLPTVELICFPGAPNLPIFVARDKGWFRDNGIDINLSTTPNSAFQAENLASGKFHIAGTAFDNVVAYQEGQGAVPLKDTDFFAFMGATQVELAFITQADIKSYADVRGKNLALDALSTGFAFVLYEMLAKNGLTKADYQMQPVGATPARWEAVKAGTHAGTLTIEPFTSIARNQGFHVLDTSTQVFPAYQGGGFAARRAWAAANPDALKGFIRGYLAGLAWTLDPANKEEATQVLLANMPEIKPQVAPAVMASLLSPRSGLTPKAAMLMDGVATVLDLRSRYGAGAKLSDPAKYIDLTYYNQVVAG
ncbi:MULTISPECIES: ABC transporter substrate-binding protein [unclassified Beijerinckia]|uniref:ABC transporter substrate-binding protein n=1 Tax=unclassified Beijerinckia TaxID=2638183 RepID=UPI0008991C59|nr:MULTISPECIES: ABC transporter substrate-binding protein [unclassified Beijerinckia]MDH7796606.1 ABC-type nitrate/sulfonate/bicarbonate transport system substrate-binding protein [Beijerinckia sp. GAS462]SEC52252.1 ABC-type nitrate/sulfonate/bicarbonate transport system, substrate-binding protein [Beijerinckia sp. 28-YEA-48]